MAVGLQPFQGKKRRLENATSSLMSMRGACSVLLIRIREQSEGCENLLTRIELDAAGFGI